MPLSTPRLAALVLFGIALAHSLRAGGRTSGPQPVWGSDIDARRRDPRLCRNVGRDSLTE